MKSQNLILAFFGMCAIIIASCTQPQPATAPAAIDMDQLKTEIQAMEDGFAAAEKMKDAEAVAAYYSEDAVSYHRAQEPTVGRNAIKDRIASRMAKDSTGNHNVYKVVDLFADGDLAVEIGSWTEVKPDSTEHDKGFYLSVFKKKDGKYNCIRDMSVSTKPEQK
ncbi:MAG: nuclear transport factor 2 family protein [Saprospiraceae bacterium]|nr:nuclear transport factor 2 family protein [Saprospiraceae bacterium]